MCIRDSSTVGAISSSPGQPHPPVVTNIPHGTHGVSISFRFRTVDMSTGQVVFALGRSNEWLSASISSEIDGQRYVMLNVAQVAQPVLHLTLISHVRTERTYSVVIVLGSPTTLLARVDGVRQFSYSLPSAIPASVLRTVRVGVGPLPSTAFQGVVDGFRITYVTTSAAQPNTGQRVLWLIAGLAGALTIMLAALRIALAAWSAGMLSASGRQARPTTWLRRAISCHCLAWGALALALGILLVCLATPLDNMVVQKTGSQAVFSPGVGPNASTSYFLGDARELANQAAAVDMDISFWVKRTGPIPATPRPITLVSTFDYQQGVKFDLDAGGVLVGTLIGAPGLLYVTNYPLLNNLSLNKWTSIELDIRRSQSYTFHVDGTPLQSFTWALPI